MARNGSGVYILPAGSTVINGDTSDATDINTPLGDIETDMNTPRPIVAGGTGASTAVAALVNLGLTATAAEINNIVERGSSFRNILINGDMAVAQDGVSAAGVTTSGYYTCDQWRASMGSLGTWTITQDATGPDGFANSLKFECTNATSSPAASAVVSVEHPLTGRDMQHLKKGTASAKSVTLGFNVKSNKTGTYVAELYDIDNTRHIAATYTISVADTWTPLTLTFAGDTTGAFDDDSAESLTLKFWLGAGTTYTSGTLATAWAAVTAANRAVGQVNLGATIGNYWQITAVQLEEGASATEFENIGYDENLERCRFFYKRWNYNADDKPITIGQVFSGTGVQFPFNTSPMNGTPTGAFSGTFNCSANTLGARTGTAAWDHLSPNGLHAIVFTNSGAALTAGDASLLRWDNTDTASYFELDARL